MLLQIVFKQDSSLSFFMQMHDSSQDLNGSIFYQLVFSDFMNCANWLYTNTWNLHQKSSHCHRNNFFFLFHGALNLSGTLFLGLVWFYWNLKYTQEGQSGLRKCCWITDSKSSIFNYFRYICTFLLTLLLLYKMWCGCNKNCLNVLYTHF